MEVTRDALSARTRCRGDRVGRGHRPFLAMGDACRTPQPGPAGWHVQRRLRASARCPARTQPEGTDPNPSGSTRSATAWTWHQATSATAFEESSPSTRQRPPACSRGSSRTRSTSWSTPARGRRRPATPHLPPPPFPARPPSVRLRHAEPERSRQVPASLSRLMPAMPTVNQTGVRLGPFRPRKPMASGTMT